MLASLVLCSWTPARLCIHSKTFYWALDMCRKLMMFCLATKCHLQIIISLWGKYFVNFTFPSKTEPSKSGKLPKNFRLSCSYKHLQTAGSKSRPYFQALQWSVNISWSSFSRPFVLWPCSNSWQLNSWRIDSWRAQWTEMLKIRDSVFS